MPDNGRYLGSILKSDRRRIRRKRRSDDEERAVKSPKLNAKLAKNNPRALSGQQVLQLQNTIGNRAVMRLLETAESTENEGRTPDATTEVIREIGTFAGMRVFYTKGDQFYHVEAYQRVGGVTQRVGVIDIKPETPIVMSANIDPESDLGNILFAVAIKLVAEEYADNDSGSVMLPNNGGDVFKLMMTKLSKVFGDRDMNTRAAQIVQMRRMAAAGASARPADLNQYDPGLLMEHLAVLRALLEGRYGGKIDPIAALGRMDERFGRSLGSGGQLNEIYFRQLMEASRDFATFPNVLFRMFAKELKLDDL
jgi:hypothetical protein